MGSTNCGSETSHTFRSLGGEFLYLVMLMDRFSRRIVGWDLQDHMRESLVLAALRAAITLRRPRPGLIHHTDRGGQYAGTQYRKMLARAGMPQSMSRAENCYDNAFMESCFGTIKTEREMEAYPNEHAARKEIPGYLRYYGPFQKNCNECRQSTRTRSASEDRRFRVFVPRWRFGLVSQFFWNGPYNTRRRHSALGYLTPEAYEAMIS